MQVGSKEIEWSHAEELATGLLISIEDISKPDSHTTRIDGAYGYKVYWAGMVLRIDIEKAAVSP